MIRKIALWMRDVFIRNRSLNATRVVAGSFAAIILVGALLLTLPIASRDGQSAGFFTGLFTATSATCVTGLILVDTWMQWSLFGQLVILAMIQLGGLGFMTVITLVSFALHRRIGLSERLIMVSTLNLNDLDGVVRMVRHALMGTFLIEGIGAVILAACMIPEFGLLGGIWRESSTLCPPSATRALTCWAAGSAPIPAWPGIITIRWCSLPSGIDCGGRPWLFCVGGYPDKALHPSPVGIQQDGAAVTVLLSWAARPSSWWRNTAIPLFWGI